MEPQRAIFRTSRQRLLLVSGVDISSFASFLLLYPRHRRAQRDMRASRGTVPKVERESGDHAIFVESISHVAVSVHVPSANEIPAC